MLAIELYAVLHTSHLYSMQSSILLCFATCGPPYSSALQPAVLHFPLLCNMRSAILPRYTVCGPPYSLAARAAPWRHLDFAQLGIGIRKGQDIKKMFKMRTLERYKCCLKLYHLEKSRVSEQNYLQFSLTERCPGCHSVMIF